MALNLRPYGTVILIALTLAGCTAEPTIEQYTVKRAGKSEPATTGEPRDRMLGAIVPHDDKHWFFKLTGGKEAVAGEVDKFQKFVESVRFSAGPGSSTPSWTLPEGWSQKPGADIRFATIEIPAQPKALELTVIPLPRDPQADEAPAVLANVNRWRGQLNLPPLAPNDLSAQSKIVEVAGAKSTIVDFEGILSGSAMGPMSRGPMNSPPSSPLPNDHPPVAGPGGDAKPAVAIDVPFKFQKPDGWLDGDVRGMRRLAYYAGKSTKAPEFTVIDLAVGGSDTVPNVQRWRQQVKLPNGTPEEIGKDVKKISLGAVEGDYVELVGETDAMLGVIVRSGDRGWFFKLSGPREAVLAQKAQFETFMQSVKF